MLEAKLEAETQRRQAVEQSLATMTSQRDDALEKLRYAEACKERLQSVLRSLKNKLKKSLNRKRTRQLRSPPLR